MISVICSRSLLEDHLTALKLRTIGRDVKRRSEETLQERFANAIAFFQLLKGLFPSRVARMERLRTCTVLQSSEVS